MLRKRATKISDNLENSALYSRLNMQNSKASPLYLLSDIIVKLKLKKIYPVFLQSFTEETCLNTGYNIMIKN